MKTRIFNKMFLKIKLNKHNKNLFKLMKQYNNLLKLLRYNQKMNIRIIIY